MYDQQLFMDLLIAGWKKQIKTVREILFTNSEFFNHPSSFDFVEEMIFKVTDTTSAEPFINFIEMGINGNLERHLKVAIIRGNLKWAELLLKNGAKLEGPEWDRHSVSRYVFCGINVDTRKEMLLLLFNYGLDPTFRCGSNWNLLHMLIEYKPEDNVDDNVEIAKFLLNLGTPVNGINNLGFSPLICSLIRGND